MIIYGSRVENLADSSLSVKNKRGEISFNMTPLLSFVVVVVAIVSSPFLACTKTSIFHSGVEMVNPQRLT